MKPFIPEERYMKGSFSYFPLIFDNEESLLKAKAQFEKKRIGSRRYFSPSLHELDFLEPKICGTPKNSQDLSKRMLCVPFHPRLSPQDAKQVVACLKV